ncbi:nucleotidyltransferase family protein [Ramlibacter humi]|uniref:nucleotidyltransferase family protein n=1 Tax=Ramlibacter humi TaxID=2530451 RepID=UPI00308413E0
MGRRRGGRVPAARQHRGRPADAAGDQAARAEGRERTLAARHARPPRRSAGFPARHPFEPLQPRHPGQLGGIDCFLVPATCVGVRPSCDGLELHAPNGLDILYAGKLAPNPLTPHLELFRRKAASYRRRWGWLQVIEYDPATTRPPDTPRSIP